MLIESAKYETNESFMSGLKSLFEEHYIEVPKEKVDIFDKILEENIQLENQINTLLNEKIEFINEKKEASKSKIVEELSEGLSLNQKTKLKLLSEAIDFTNAEDYKSKVFEVKNAYFTKSVKKNDIDVDTTPVQLTEEKTSSAKMTEVDAVVDVINRMR